MRGLTKAWVPTLVALVCLLAACPTYAQWTWKDPNGKTRTRAELDNILKENHVYEESQGKRGARAGLFGADLNGAELNGAFLTGADLRGANLKGADLVGAHLNGAYLTGAYLTGADVGGADLNGAELSGAHLNRAVLTRAHLGHADLVGAVLGGADLNGADLDNARLNSADLSGAELVQTDLRHAHLGYADLVGAELGGADLTGADLDESKLKDVDFNGADLEHVKFEPITLPELRGIAAAKNLKLLWYDDDPDALSQLRKQFADGGFREQARKITYALKRRETEKSWQGCTSRKLPDGKTPRAILWSSDSNVANCGSYVLNRVFFDLTCQYGMSPGRPLDIGVLIWFVCSVLYFACIRSTGKAGLYRVYAQSFQEPPVAQRRVERISPVAITHTHVVRRHFQYLWREWPVFRACMFFSMMSAFNIGFRDINFGRWLRSLTRQEFDIKAVGWARVISGWQSLLSVYLIALWVLSYFGHPFG